MYYRIRQEKTGFRLDSHYRIRICPDSCTLLGSAFFFLLQSGFTEGQGKIKELDQQSCTFKLYLDPNKVNKIGSRSDFLEGPDSVFSKSRIQIIEITSQQLQIKQKGSSSGSGFLEGSDPVFFESRIQIIEITQCGSGSHGDQLFDHNRKCYSQHHIKQRDRPQFNIYPDPDEVNPRIRIRIM